MSTPFRRREGRNAFYRGGNPNDHQPYGNGKSGLTGDIHAADWLAGWKQAEEADEIAIMHEDLADFDKVQEFARLYNLAKEQGLI